MCVCTETNKWVDQKTVVHLHNRKKEGAYNLQDSVVGTGEH